MAAPPPLVPLRAAVQNYAWGLPADRDSLVARLHALNAPAPVSPATPYAELWIGTHPSAPAHVIADQPVSLQQFLTSTQQPPIPYLLKVLSVAKPLSIQAHPDKHLARRLHAANPDAYKDDNHKPEMSVALTDFEAMCNFRPVDEILAHLHALPDLRHLCDGDAFIASVSRLAAHDDKKPALRHLFSTLMHASEHAVSAALNAVLEKLKMRSNNTDADQLFLQLVRHYPRDVGCFAAYLLNYVQIAPGQAFFMAANEPHAYLSGQCVEIMACSDNVVRAGLTPKFKDVSTLVDMLTYRDEYPHIMHGTAVDTFSTLYRPPADEFQLIHCAIPPATAHALPPLRGPSIIMCLDGAGWIGVAATASHAEPERLPLAAGRIYYVADSVPLHVHAKRSAVAGAASPHLVFFRASANQAQLTAVPDASQ